jgi:hypothetical protein
MPHPELPEVLPDIAWCVSALLAATIELAFELLLLLLA